MGPSHRRMKQWIMTSEEIGTWIDVRIAIVILCPTKNSNKHYSTVGGFPEELLK